MIKNCSIIIPCFKTSKKLLEKNIIDIKNNWNDPSIKFDIILVLDGNINKESFEFQSIYELKKNYNEIKILRNKDRLGQQTSVLNGFDYCHSDIAITIDDDYKYPVNKLCDLSKELYLSNFDCYIGKPENNNVKKIRLIGTNLVKKIFNLVYKKDHERIHFSSFRILKKKVFKNIIKKNYLLPVVGYLILEETNQVKNFKYDKNQFNEKSRYNFLSLIKYFYEMNLFYTGFFYKISIYSGLCLTIISICLMIKYLYIYFFSVTSTQPGFTTLVLLLLLILQIMLYCSALTIKYLTSLIGFFKNIEFKKIKTYEEIL